MTELKTLKDLDFYLIEKENGKKTDAITKTDLKAEAIKWLKRLKDKKFYNNKENLWWFIEHFFNLTEEDLK